MTILHLFLTSNTRECFNTAIASELMIQQTPKITIEVVCFYGSRCQEIGLQSNCVHLSLFSQMKFWNSAAFFVAILVLFL